MNCVGLFVLFFAGACSAEHSVRCSDSNQTSTSFEPSKDGVVGRYIVEHCKRYDKNKHALWELLLLFMNDSTTRTRDQCKIYNYTQKTTLYSRFTEILDNTILNCTNVCYSKPLDLISNGCYVIKTWVRGRLNEQASETVHYVRSQMDNFSYVNKTSAYIIQRSYGEIALVNWYLGYVPATDYSVKLSVDNENYTSEREKYLHEEWESITENCTTLEINRVQCPLRLPWGCYNIMLTHTAPWTQGRFFYSKRSHTFHFCHEKPIVPTVEGNSGKGILWACGAAALVCVAAFAAALVWRSRLAAAWHKRVLRDWRTPRYESTLANPPKSPPVGGVLLLYARDCEPFMNAMSLLRQLLKEVTQLQVYDLFSPETSAIAASASGEWVRTMIRRDDVRVLLVQTPAAACLYGAQPQGPEQHYVASEPLLNQRVVYRSPHHGDALFQYVLRLLKETAHNQLAYKKYYIATLSELPAEVVESVAVFRRYELPGAMHLLLHHLSPHLAHTNPTADSFSADVQRLVNEFSQALSDMVEYARTNENYLQDLLMFL